MTGMVIARAASMSFWEEFWFEYFVGFVIGWTVFQRKSMTMMTDNLAKQLAMAFRGEFFSMLTVMGGMGAVMTFVAPLVATSQLKPLTYAFWGFGMLGLLVGCVMTYPMKWMMLKVGWKHGMGGMKGAEKKQVESPSMKFGLVAAMCMLGFIGLLLPAWLAHARARLPSRNEQSVVAVSQANPAPSLHAGLQAELERALAGLRQGDPTEASLAMDDALRAAEVGAHSAPGSFYSSLEQIRAARIAYQQGHESEALQHLVKADEVVTRPQDAKPDVLDAGRYKGATVIDERGRIIGKIMEAPSDGLDVALGGWLRTWGVVLQPKRASDRVC